MKIGLIEVAMKTARCVGDLLGLKTNILLIDYAMATLMHDLEQELSKNQDDKIPMDSAQWLFKTSVAENGCGSFAFNYNFIFNTRVRHDTKKENSLVGHSHPVGAQSLMSNLDSLGSCKFR